jgi:hypothetical protein
MQSVASPSLAHSRPSQLNSNEKGNHEAHEEMKGRKPTERDNDDVAFDISVRFAGPLHNLRALRVLRGDISISVWGIS